MATKSRSRPSPRRSAPTRPKTKPATWAELRGKKRREKEQRRKARSEEWAIWSTRLKLAFGIVAMGAAAAAGGGHLLAHAAVLTARRAWPWVKRAAAGFRRGAARAGWAPSVGAVGRIRSHLRHLGEHGPGFVVSTGGVAVPAYAIDEHLGQQAEVDGEPVKWTTGSFPLAGPPPSKTAIPAAGTGTQAIRGWRPSHRKLTKAFQAQVAEAFRPKPALTSAAPDDVPVEATPVGPRTHYHVDHGPANVDVVRDDDPDLYVEVAAPRSRVTSAPTPSFAAPAGWWESFADLCNWCDDPPTHRLPDNPTGDKGPVLAACKQHAFEWSEGRIERIRLDHKLPSASITARPGGGAVLTLPRPLTSTSPTTGGTGMASGEGNGSGSGGSGGGISGGGSVSLASLEELTDPDWSQANFQEDVPDWLDQVSAVLTKIAESMEEVSELGERVELPEAVRKNLSALAEHLGEAPPVATKTANECRELFESYEIPKLD